MSVLAGPFMTSGEAAAYLGFKGGAQTMRNLKSKGAGPSFERIGNRLAYREQDLLAWIAECKEMPGAGTPGATSTNRKKINV